MPSEAIETFSDLLRHHRVAAGLTQRVLAERAGLSVDGIQKLERGATHPYRDIARHLANALELPPAERARFLDAVVPGRRRGGGVPGEALTAALPSGTVTLLFTDIEGSTRLWEQNHEGMRAALVRHDELIEQLVAEHGGTVVRPRGEGDSRFAVFGQASAAIAAAAAIQVALHRQPWPLPEPLRVRMALHTGEADLRDGDYYGKAPNRCARLRALAHGGQVLLSAATGALVGDSLRPQLSLQDLGVHRLKDLGSPEHVFQLVHPELRTDFPPLHSIDALPTNLPVQVTSFVGRDAEMMDVKRVMSNARLVTLTGGGGSGKTRLALQVAADLIDQYADGVWLVDLAALTQSELVPHAVAAAIGLREEAAETVLQSLTRALGARHILLLFDNCEHLVAACAHLAAHLLHACVGLHILATSRERLGVHGEQLWLVPPLRVPRSGQSNHLTASDAVQLFTERAQLVQPSFTLDYTNAPIIAEICRRLDALPLAIELAAARVGFLGLEELAARMDVRLQLLTGGTRTGPLRQQTLRATVDWSYTLLEPDEQRLFEQLSVFAGSWDLAAAEATCDLVPPSVVPDVLSRLVDRSMVATDLTSTGNKMRYRLLETLREYAWERLIEHGEVANASARHCEFFLALAESAERELAGPEQRTWLDRLDRDHDNLRAALAWTRESNKVEAGLRLAVAVGRFWAIRGHLAEGRLVLEALLEQICDPPVPAVLRAKALRCVGNLAFGQGDWAAAAAYFDSSLSLGESTGDRWRIAEALRDLGSVAQARGAYDRASAFYERSLVLRRQIQDKRGMAECLDDLGEIARHRGQYAQAVAFDEEALVLQHEVGDKWGMAFSLNELANVARHQGEYAHARVHATEALELQRELGDLRGMGYSLNNLGIIAQVTGNDEQAARLYEEAMELFGRTGDKRGVSVVLPGLSASAVAGGRLEEARVLAERALQLSRDLGEDRAIALRLDALARIARAEADATTAWTLHRESLVVFARISDRRGIAMALDGAANVLSSQGAAERAVELFAVATALTDAIGVAPELGAYIQPSERRNMLMGLRARLGDEAFDQIWEHGLRLPTDDVVAAVLSHGPPVPTRAPNRAARPAHQLTNREQEVARLVAQGLTNREIGKVLVISAGTVRVHVEHVLSKLGFRSRAEIAAWAVQHQFR